MRQALIDADVLRYEIGYAAEVGWKGEDSFPPFDYVAELLDNRISNICAVVEADTPPILFLTGKSNFRNDIAKRRKYKDRDGRKPFHFKNLTAYMNAMYEVRKQEGLEADDLMSIEQTNRPGETIICTRDKDLRQVAGWHYGWELGNQPQFGPQEISEFGSIELKRSKSGIKIVGGGYKFFLSQCITGDSVDTVPGLKGYGPVKAFEMLDSTQGIPEAFKVVRDAYTAVYGDEGDAELLEQGQLLWMVRQIQDDKPIMWSFPIEN